MESLIFRKKMFPFLEITKESNLHAQFREKFNYVFEIIKDISDAT